MNFGTFGTFGISDQSKTNLKAKFCFDKFIFPLNAIIFEYNIDCNASSV